VIELRLFPHLFCKNLTMPSFIGNFVSPNRTAVSLIRWLFLKYLCPSEGKKIYLKRTNYRIITNENEVWEILSRKGFELVQPEKLTFLEQIQLFSKCDVVIGNGSGLSNTVFCNKGTKVLNFDSPTWLDIFHWYHAESNDLDYYQMTGIPFNPTAVINPQTDGCKSFIINIDELKEMLNIMGI
ncbi:MAG: glycosyltransferase family 61 protein, partial [Candidatus Staskawiczbacteria bacterium]